MSETWGQSFEILAGSLKARNARVGERAAKRLGYEIVRGAYSGTSDDRIDRWYVQHVDDTVVDRRGGGHQTKLEALRGVYEHFLDLD